MPEQRFILYTRHDGGVATAAPSLTALRYMTNGGGRWDHVIPHEPRGFLDRQIAEQANYGVGEPSALRWVKALQFGGCSEAEGYENALYRFCAHLGTAFELVDHVPYDKWFRNAWRRSHNGGPVYVAMPIARKIQERRLRELAASRKLELKWNLWRSRIRRAETPEALKAVWPAHG